MKGSAKYNKLEERFQPVLVLRQISPCNTVHLLLAVFICLACFFSTLPFGDLGFLSVWIFRQDIEQAWLKVVLPIDISFKMQDLIGHCEAVPFPSLLNVLVFDSSLLVQGFPTGTFLTTCLSWWSRLSVTWSSPSASALRTRWTLRL